MVGHRRAAQALPVARGVAVTRWEYMVMPFAHDAGDGATETALDEEGERGWELVAVVMVFDRQIAYLKRPIEGSAEE